LLQDFQPVFYMPANGKTMKISRARARRLAVEAQGLGRPWKVPKGADGAAQVVEHLGYVQIDTIAVIERAHHHVWWTRQPDYQPSMLDQLLAHDRRVFEYWTHAASYVPMADLRYYLPVMAQARNWRREKTWYQEKGNAAVVRQVLKRIRSEGGLRGADFKDDSRRRGPWWDWKPAKRALEYLFNTGELMVSARPSFQRVYDLPERVVPSHIDTRLPTEAERLRFVVRRALAGHGVIAVKSRPHGLHQGEKVAGVLAELIDAGEATLLEIEGQPQPYYALTARLADCPKRPTKALHLLSPFDNLIIDRQRAEALFDFHYRIECYTPQAKRRYGYFSLPILWGDALIGRLDAKAHRREKELAVRGLFFEEGFDAFDAALKPLAAKLQAFARFNGCEKVQVEKSEPAKVKAPLNRLLKEG
jgi:uncharacterized protein